MIAHTSSLLLVLASLACLSSSADRATAAIEGAQLAWEIGQWVCQNRSMDEAERPNRLQDIDIEPMHRWSGEQINGAFILSFGSDSVHEPKHGIGMTVDPFDPCHLEFQSLGDGTSSIRVLFRANGYLFAGDQATVKCGHSSVGHRERFKVYHTTINGQRFCAIKCIRDGEYWYVDKEGMIRHRNKKEQGFKCHVFYMQEPSDLHHGILAACSEIDSGIACSAICGVTAGSAISVIAGSAIGSVTAGSAIGSVAAGSAIGSVTAGSAIGIVAAGSAIGSVCGFFK